MEISEEQLKELKSFFDYFDKDGSGSLDKQVSNSLCSNLTNLLE